MTSLDNLDVFYLSYDEPNAEQHWADLLTKVPWANRVHGVEGFDAAHKACAKQSATTHFITVDGDNKFDLAFYEQTLSFSDHDRRVWSWSSRNAINDLVYGNGGVKVWSKEFVLSMNTHEASLEENAAVDFCWQANYVYMSGVYSTTHPNGSPEQAFRAGFREGVKMCLLDGKRTKEFERLPETNRMRLFVWCSVGADVENGTWAMIGARVGAAAMRGDPDFDYTVIRDYDAIHELFIENQDRVRLDGINGCLWHSGEHLRSYGMCVAELDEHGSRFFKLVDAPPRDKIMRNAYRD